ncbi:MULTISPECIES: iron-containing alcohol dehydrogenase [unclassified Sporosarcina]|uniref:iron-containing alcohol dehydrogenase n=1 Tax=unclassified Sporosarcina TaxID=2647733 RepID=UPI0026F443D2|nr:iron-containing alcohol dehydrogenase [Sporosarcina sp. P35]
MIYSNEQTGYIREGGRILYKFVMPEVIFGKGSIDQAGDGCARLGAQRVLVVSDDGVQAAGWTERVMESCLSAGLSVSLFTGVSINPTSEEVEACAGQYIHDSCDAVVGVGGGSVLDVAKAAAILATNGGHIRDYEGIDHIHRPLPPLVMVTTTAGSGSDVSQFAIILDPERKKKMTIVSKSLVPDISIVDPAVLSTKSARLTASTGLDVLTHAIESYVSIASTPLTDVHAKSSIQLCAKYLRESVASADNQYAKEQMAIASLHAGLAFSNAILGAVHAIAHSIGGHYPFLHGDINAVMLPHVMKFNASAAPGRFKDIAHLLGENTDGLSSSEASDLAIAHVERLAVDIGAPLTLTGMGFKEESIPIISEISLEDACMITNPRMITADEVAALLYQAL